MHGTQGIGPDAPEQAKQCSLINRRKRVRTGSEHSFSTYILECRETTLLL